MKHSGFQWWVWHNKKSRYSKHTLCDIALPTNSALSTGVSCQDFLILTPFEDISNSHPFTGLGGLGEEYVSDPSLCEVYTSLRILWTLFCHRLVISCISLLYLGFNIPFAYQCSLFTSTSFTSSLKDGVRKILDTFICTANRFAGIQYIV